MTRGATHFPRVVRCSRDATKQMAVGLCSRFAALSFSLINPFTFYSIYYTAIIPPLSKAGLLLFCLPLSTLRRMPVFNNDDGAPGARRKSIDSHTCSFLRFVSISIYYKYACRCKVAGKFVKVDTTCDSSTMAQFPSKPRLRGGIVTHQSNATTGISFSCFHRSLHLHTSPSSNEAEPKRENHCHKRQNHSLDSHGRHSARDEKVR